MTQVNDLSHSLVSFEQNSSVTVVVEMSESSWLVAGQVPGLERQPLKKLDPDPAALLSLMERWREEAVKAGRTIERIALAFEAGRDGFWLARWLRARDIEVHVIHSTSVAVSREHRRAKTDRLDTAMLMRVFLGWLRGERGHCGMVAIPRSRKRMPDVQAVSEKVWWASARGSSTASRRSWRGSGSAASTPKCAERWNALTRCGHRMVCRCHRTQLTSSGAI